MKTYFGNYIGLVIDDVDPQQRGRVKVFIPHIMPALYKGWNEEGKDIKFNITGENILTGLNKKKIDALRKILPWAECAAPVFGAGPGGHFNYATGELDAVMLNRGNGEFGQDSQLEKQGAGAETVSSGSLPANLPNSTGSITVNSDGSVNIPGLNVNNSIIPGRTYGIDATQNAQPFSNIVIHDPGGPITLENLVNYVQTYDPSRGGTFGYSLIIDKDGSVYQTAPWDARTNHIGPEVRDSVPGLSNTNALGISLMGNSTDVTAAQVQSLQNIIAASGIRNIYGHGEITPNREPEEGQIARQMREIFGTQAATKDPENPSKDPYKKADANSKTDPTKETDSIEDEGFDGAPLIGEDEDLPDIVTSQNNNLTTKFTAYSPQASGSSTIGLEGGYASSKPGPDGQYTVRTLQDVASGNANYVTLAGDPSTYGQSYTIPSITFTNASGQTQTLTNVLGVVHDTGSAFTGAGTSKFDVAVDKDLTPNQINTQPFLANGGDAEITDSGVIEITAAASQNPPISNPSPYGSVGGPNTNYMPTGMFGNARTGQMVWVFFQEGDPLYPVYFAASYGASEWANINKHSSPDGIKDVDTPAPVQGVQTTMQLVGGGLASKQLISGPEGGNNFEKDEFTFEIFGKNGSNLTFTFHATLLNSKYDFRQHTQADAHYITGGNRTDRTIGDFNTVCEQDVILTVGNWSQDAIEAANNIQGIINQAMKAAKDTYES